MGSGSTRPKTLQITSGLSQRPSQLLIQRNGAAHLSVNETMQQWVQVGRVRRAAKDAANDQHMKMAIQRTWASVIGVASTAIGILTFCSIVHIPTLDAAIHVITGALFIAGAWTNKGQYVSQTNRWLGIFYVIFGIIGMNWAHIIAGVVSILIGLLTWEGDTATPWPAY
jgi:hypothetical protein